MPAGGSSHLNAPGWVHAETGTLLALSVVGIEFWGESDLCLQEFRGSV